jgi:hypothetical protein
MLRVSEICLDCPEGEKAREDEDFVCSGKIIVPVYGYAESRQAYAEGTLDEGEVGVKVNEVEICGRRSYEQLEGIKD